MIDIKTMSNKELAELQLQINTELDKRQQEEHKVLWDKIKESLHEYTSKYGDIHIINDYGDDYYLTRYDEYPTIGVIDQSENGVEKRLQCYEQLN